MINLLSSVERGELAAAQRNVRLRQYMFILLMLGGVITASYGVGYIILNNQANAYRADVERYAPEKEKYADVIKQATSFNSNLFVAKSIINDEFSYSGFLELLSSMIPHDAVLAGINIHTVDFAKPIELTIDTKSYAASYEVKKTFETSPYFRDTKLRAITQAPEGTYPYTTAIITTVNVDLIKKRDIPQ